MLASSNVNAKIPNMWLSAFPSDEGSPKAGVGLLTHPVTLRVPPLCTRGMLITLNAMLQLLYSSFPSCRGVPEGRGELSSFPS